FFFSTDGLEVVRNILIVVFGLSFMHNLFLGFEFTYMIPQTKYTLIMTACFAFLTGNFLSSVTAFPVLWLRYTAAKLDPPLKWHGPLDKTSGILLLSALLLYHHMLTQGESVYYSSYKVSWIIFTAYLNILLLFTSGECPQGP
ncbi:TMEM225, partial [Cervus elaphus hippelaphus]